MLISPPSSLIYFPFYQNEWLLIVGNIQYEQVFIKYFLNIHLPQAGVKTVTMMTSMEQKTKSATVVSFVHFHRDTVHVTNVVALPSMRQYYRKISTYINI